MTIANIAANAVPFPGSSIAGLSRLYCNRPGLRLNIKRLVEDDIAIEGLAKLLTSGIDKVTRKDGRMDTRELAAFVLNHMRENG